MNTNEVLKLALEALESCGWNDGYAGENQYFHDDLVDKAITALQKALAQPTSADYAMGYAEGFDDACKPAPVQQAAYTMYDGKGKVIVHFDAKEAPAQQDSGLTNRYTAPQPAQRTWVGLSLDEIDAFEKGSLNRQALCCAIEAKLRSKNT